MTIVKEKSSSELARDWAIELSGEPYYQIGRYWAVDKERKAYFTRLGQDREFNDDGYIVEYFTFFFNGKYLFLNVFSSSCDDKNIDCYEVYNKNRVDINLFNEAKEFGLDDFLTIYNKYSDVFADQIVSNYSCKIIY